MGTRFLTEKEQSERAADISKPNDEVYHKAREALLSIVSARPHNSDATKYNIICDGLDHLYQFITKMYELHASQNSQTMAPPSGAPTESPGL